MQHCNIIHHAGVIKSKGDYLYLKGIIFSIFEEILIYLTWNILII